MLVDYASQFHCKATNFRFLLWTEGTCAKLGDPVAYSGDSRVG